MFMAIFCSRILSFGTTGTLIWGFLFHSGSFAFFTTVPPAPPSHLHAIPTILPRVHGRPDVQKSKFVVGKDFSTVVVIDHVAHFFAATVDDPIVTVEWQLVANKDTKKQSRFSLTKEIDNRLTPSAALNGRVANNLSLYRQNFSALDSHILEREGLPIWVPRNHVILVKICYYRKKFNQTSCQACSLLVLWILIISSMSLGARSDSFQRQPFRSMAFQNI